MRTSESFGAIVAALLTARSKIPALRKRGNNPDTNSKYVKLDDMVPAIVPALRDQGVLVMQSSEIVDRVVIVRTRFMLNVDIETVQWIECDSSVPLVGRTLKGGAKAEADPQAGGSAISYARRYGLATALCLVADEDDDGRAARPRETPAKAAAAPRNPPLDLDKNKQRLAQARAYEVGSFIMPFGSVKDMTKVEEPKLVALAQYATNNGLHALRTDVEMVLTELRKTGTDGKKE